MAGWWAETFANISARAQAVAVALSGEQPGAGSLLAKLNSASAQLTGNQPFTGQISATAKPAQAQLSGVEYPQGDLAILLRSALFNASGSTGFEGTISAQLRAATAALLGEQTQLGSIAALLRPASVLLAGEQPYAGPLAALLRPASAAMVGNQPFTGQISALLRAASVAMSGAQAQQGSIAAQARAASASFGGAQASGLFVVDAAANHGNTVAFPAHQPGDMLVMYAYTGNLGAAPGQPVPGGTVPTWTTIDTNASNTNGEKVSWGVATSSDHTAGVWSNATDVIVVVLRGQAASPIGGFAVTGGLTTGPVTCPAITMSNTSGSSVLLHLGGRRSASGFTDWASPPTGYTRRAQVVSGTGVFCNTKDNTVTDGSVNQDITGTTTSLGYQGATVEILA